MGLDKIGEWFRPLCNETDPERARCFRDAAEGVSNAVVREVLFDSHGTICDREYGWEFDKLELIQWVTVGWKELHEFGVVGFGEVWFFREQT